MMNPYAPQPRRKGTLAASLAGPAPITATTPMLGVTGGSGGGGIGFPGIPQGAYQPGGLKTGQYPAQVGNGFAPAVHRKAGQIQQDFQNFSLNNALTAGPQLWQQIQALTQQAGQSQMSPELRAAFLAPRQEGIAQEFDQAEGRLDQNLLERGIDRSSGAAGAYAGLQGERARAGSNLYAQLYQTEDDRQRTSQAQLRDLLAALLSGQGAAASGQANTLQQLALQKSAQEGPDILSQLFGGIGQLGGAYLGRR